MVLDHIVFHVMQDACFSIVELMEPLQAQFHVFSISPPDTFDPKHLAKMANI